MKAHTLFSSLALTGSSLLPHMGAATGSGGRGAVCSTVAWDLAASAENAKFANTPDPNNTTAILQYIFQDSGPPFNGTQKVGGQFHVVGTYCYPAAGWKDQEVLQVLVHGLSYTRSYWFGLGLADKYNWQLAAARRGYATLSLDRVGHGESRGFPDYLQGSQVALHSEIIINLIRSIKRSRHNPLGRAFSSVVHVGHSYGSVVGMYMVANHAAEFDAFVHTGLSTTSYAPTAALLAGDLTSARDVYPARLGSLPDGYLAVQTESVREAFYGGAYDRAVALYDYATADTLTPGELLVQAVATTPVPGMRKPVFVVTGAVDKILCNPNQVLTCDQILNLTGLLFPDSVKYSYYAVPNTGHDIALHYSAPKTFEVISDWLDDTLF